MRTLGLVLLYLAVFLAITMLFNLGLAWAGNNFLVEAGLNEVSYWTWYWFSLLFGMFGMGSSNSNK